MCAAGGAQIWYNITSLLCTSDNTKENKMNIAIGSDHGGVELKAALVNALAGAAKVVDMGPADKASCDYPARPTSAYLSAAQA